MVIRNISEKIEHSNLIKEAHFNGMTKILKENRGDAFSIKELRKRLGITEVILSNAEILNATNMGIYKGICKGKVYWKDINNEIYLYMNKTENSYYKTICGYLLMVSSILLLYIGIFMLSFVFFAIGIIAVVVGLYLI